MSDCRIVEGIECSASDIICTIRRVSETVVFCSSEKVTTGMAILGDLVDASVRFISRRSECQRVINHISFSRFDRPVTVTNSDNGKSVLDLYENEGDFIMKLNMIDRIGIFTGLFCFEDESAQIRLDESLMNN